ncbi:hypothetical protein NMY22_g19944 [Coprinellus aureogranulatus]|nr:hypothetical protein NMY22_g19944 [Coprinellus aureogranulatus]
MPDSTSGQNHPGASARGGPHHTYHTYNYISQAQNVVTGPNYGQVNQQGSGSGAALSWDSLPLSLQPILDASHTRDRRRSPPNSSCLPGTRTKVLGRIIGWATNKSFDGPAREESGESGSEAGCASYAGDHAYNDDVKVNGGSETGEGNGCADENESEIVDEQENEDDWETEDEDGSGHLDGAENEGSLGEEDKEDDWETEDDDDSGPESEPYDHTAPHPHQLSLMHWEYFGLEFLDTPIPPAYHLLWLCGPAGDGKSAVSQAVCEALDGMGLLLASFFFFRGSGTRSKIARFVVTLAIQMVEIIPETAPLVAAALKVPSLAGAGVVTQFQRLVLQPLQAVMSLVQGASDQVCAPPFIVVIDGADECDDRDDMAELIEHLLEVFKENPRLPLRILFVSRIEAHIQGRLEDGRVHIENLRCYQALEDITLLVNDTFERARKRDRVIRSYGRRWPSDSQVRSLVNHANGSFIFARTLLDYILGLDSVPLDGLTPMDRLECALNLNGLDALYVDILQRSQHIPHFQDILLPLGAAEEADTLNVVAVSVEDGRVDGFGEDVEMTAKHSHGDVGGEFGVQGRFRC